MGADFMDTVLGEILYTFKAMENRVFWAYVLDDKKFQIWTLDLIRQDQLFKEGEDGNGKILGLYSAYTEEINPEKKAGSHYTLHDTGDFYESMIFNIFVDYIEINADPIKTDKITGEETNLFQKYGEDILKLNEENLELFKKELLKKYIETVKMLSR
jgi:hypothetical protein